MELPPSQLRSLDRALLQAIADQCSTIAIDPSGSLGTCVVGYHKLAAVAGMSPMTAFRHLKTLLGAGLIVQVNRGGFHKITGECFANGYAIPGHFGALDGRRITDKQPTSFQGYSVSG